MNRSGLTLIEVVLAIALFTVVFMVLANTQITSLKVTRDSQTASDATQVANDVLEEAAKEVLRKIGPDNAIVFYYDCGYKPTSVDCNPSGTLSNGYSYDATITGLYQASADPAVDPRTVDEFLQEGLVRIDVVVTGHATAKFTSYVSCYDVSDELKLEQGEPCPDPYDPDLEGGP